MRRTFQVGPAGLLLTVLALLVLVGATEARANPSGPVERHRALLLPTLTEPHEPDAAADAAVQQPPDSKETLARRVDAALQQAVQDLGLGLELERLPREAFAAEDALPRLARDRWVISPRVRTTGGVIRLRVVAVPPGSEVVLSTATRIEPQKLEVRSMVLLRDLVLTRQCNRPVEKNEAIVAAAPETRPAKSSGRAVLAANGTVLGGYVGYSLQRASGSDDARLLYPLMALGSGVGLGGSMIAAHEWDIGVGDAWYLSAGTWWPLFSGVLLADAYRVEPETDRYVYGMIGAAAGVSLGAVAIAMRPATEGDALLAHSGGAMGMLLGGLTQLTYRGDLEAFPSRGMGYGAGIGVVVAGALATRLDVSASRVLLVDLGAALGALTGAAVAGSVLIVDAPDYKSRNRTWLASVAGGMLIGGAVAAWITRESVPGPRSNSPTAIRIQPYAGPLGDPYDAQGDWEPSFGAGLTGTW